MDESELPMSFDPDFLLMLDVGAHEEDSKSRVVDRYECAWWAGRKPQDSSAVEILNQSCLGRCLECKGTLQSPSVPLPPAPASFRDLHPTSARCSPLSPLPWYS